MEAVSVVLMTAPSKEVAEQIVTAVVEEQLAACGNILEGVTSIYRWQGAVQRDSEVLVLFKTRSATVAKLVERIESLHPYDVPEAIELPVTTGSAAYLDWVRGNTGVM